MRDAFGGIVNITMIVVFLVIVSGYLAFNVTYTKAFRMKNKIITVLEQYEGCENDDQACKKELDNYAQSIGYNTNLTTYKDSTGKSYECMGRGYCWAKFSSGEGDNTKYYFKVVTSITIDIPIINKILTGVPFFQLTGNTKLITMR